MVRKVIGSKEQRRNIMWRVGVKIVFEEDEYN
jgi:hypothetical protein